MPTEDVVRSDWLTPVEMGGRTYVDVRELHHPETTEEHRQRGRTAAHCTLLALGAMPPELLPDHRNRQEKSREGRGSTFDLSEDQMLGDVAPIVLATFDGVACLGMFGLLGIRHNGPRERVRCRIFQGETRLVDAGAHSEWAVRFSDLMEFVALRRFRLVGGGALVVDQVSAAVYHQQNGTDSDARLRAFSAEMERRGNRRNPYRAEDRQGWGLFSLGGGA